MARLFADENFPLPTVDALRTLGHDVETAMDANRANLRIPDDEVLRYASGQDRAVLTLNRRHYFRLQRQGLPHAGIIACTWDPDFDALAGRINAELAGAADLHNRLLRVIRLGG